MQIASSEAPLISFEDQLQMNAAFWTSKFNCKTWLTLTKKSNTEKSDLFIYTCTFFLTFMSSVGLPAESLCNLFSDLLIKSVISWVRFSIRRWSSLPSPNDGINAFAWAFVNSDIFERARCTFDATSSDTSTQAGGRPTSTEPFLYQKNLISFVERTTLQ